MGIAADSRHSEPVPERRRIFRMGAVTFDEARLELLVDGERRPLEAKPLALLHALLLRDGTVVTKRALIEAVWGNADHISESSLTVAMSKLRTALGETARDLIQVVPGAGYRIVAPVEVSSARTDLLAVAFQPGDTVPGRPQWRLDRLLSAPPLNDVWLARHGQTYEARVFKFADSEARLETLRREAALSCVLHATLGARDDLVRILEWNFEERPYFIESAYGGQDLIAWAASQGGLAALELETRLSMLAKIARSVGAAHAAGVLHSDIKPANVLVEGPVEALQLRLVDFGAGVLGDAARLLLLTTRMHGLTGDTGGRGTGTLRYMAPEVVAGGVPTTAADIYALGILLYQLVTGDLRKSLAVGWEADVEDELLREDIEAAAAGDPQRRLASAISLAERLEALAGRRAALLLQKRAMEREADLARQVERAVLRRPWIIAAAGSLALGLALSTTFGLRAVHDRDETRRRAELAQAVNAFLTEDLLGRGNPAQSGKADETLMAAAEAAEAGIDRRLGREPLVAGSIFLSLARAFDSRGAYEAARTAYGNAIAAFGKAGDAGSATIAQLHQASMEAISGQPSSMAKAKTMLAQAGSRVAGLGKRHPEAEVWLASGKAMIDMLGGDSRAARAGFKNAADRADAMPEVFDESTRLELREREAFTLLRLGEWPEAETLIRSLVGRRLALSGPHHADTLQAELNMAQVRIAQGDSAWALPELNRIYPDFVSVFGPAHRMTLQFLGTRAQALSQLERYGDAETDQMTIYRLVIPKQGNHSYFALATLADASQSRCRAGDTAAGLATARTAYDGALSAFGAGSVLTQDASVDVAFCLIATGQYAQALPYLSGIDPKSLAEATMDPDYGAELDLMHAAIAQASGDAVLSQALLAKVVQVLTRPSTDTYMRRWLARLQKQGNAAH
jgi:DNA-binding winged helix-turn-helix (wHTH) protein/tetratricopeptide (TPR) repeat protein